ncbi:type I phosphomannose isomerase catalytic subunit [Mangrovibacterium diazotrophicum]|uniref:Phosphohexomutase n=1 Tax=Mangrovibacterium diazotrophicum TaxID=1261403 RepID=A0A419VW82_9BACT|nr:type I phosphomannose isomerase catalytic subunit [Mangrovibacterium diazotrophicum]RKD86429.1 mannose-6-phosphate isomerase type 1 [Mangrovibacterium diazotrophicum]
MQNLYPLKFTPLYHDKIWGGHKLKTALGKDFGDLPNCGESWELSGVTGNISEVSNGFLAGNNLEELIEVYMGDLVGDKVYEKFSVEFPLLIKFIDANDDLSVQVHPNDEMAKERHQAFGKTEMWYVLQADKGSKLQVGFNGPMDKETYLKKMEQKEIMDVLNFVEVEAGDVFFMPAGRVHAIGKGIMVAEIQQTSDITYRIYDYDRKDANGNERELHTELAVDAIDFTYNDSYKTDYTIEKNKRTDVVKCNYFNTGILEFDATIEKDIYGLDSFVIYICVEGEYEISTADYTEKVKMGETILVPASVHQYKLKPLSPNVKVLEVHL